jgi:hypothetical protein
VKNVVAALLFFFMTIAASDNAEGGHRGDRVFKRITLRDNRVISASWYDVGSVTFYLKFNQQFQRVLIAQGQKWIPVDLLGQELQHNIDAAIVDCGLGVDAKDAMKNLKINNFQRVVGRFLAGVDAGGNFIGIPIGLIDPIALRDLPALFAEVEENRKKNEPARELLARMDSLESAVRDAEWAARNAESAARNAEWAAQDAQQEAIWQGMMTRSDIFMYAN